ALKLMQERQFRHIPVVSAHGGILGMLSIRDLYGFVTAELENNLRSCELYVAGESYGVGA
ncbi:CBS domain-containing protein, partial [Escherichia coli]|nr:CBS domain-containing protein [Escherichia coli]